MSSPSKIDLDKIQHCYFCGEVIEDINDLVIKKFPIVGKNNKMYQKNRKLHMKCLFEYNEKVDNVELRTTENSDWEAVYEYFRGDILGLPKSTPLQYHEIQRLLGLRLGFYYPSGNNTRILKRGYDFKTILVTMKVVKPKIKSYMATTNFQNDKHRIDGIMRFISGEINDVYVRMENQKKGNEKLMNQQIAEEVSTIDHEELYRRKKEKERQKQKESDLQQGIELLFGDKL